jgi:cardiolipin synthase
VPIIKHASHAFLTPLLKAGIEIYQRQETVLHAKVMLIDGYWATIGSANFDLRSFHRNYEVNVIVDDPEFGRQVDDMFAGDLARSRRLTLEEHERRSWYERLLEQFSASLSWFL